MGFLTQSSEARDAERSERQRQRQRELEAEQEKAAIQARNAKRMGAATIFCAALAAVAGFFGWQAHQASETAKQKETEASDNLRESQIMQSRWLIDVAEQNGDQSTRILLALEALPSAQELAAEGLPDGQSKKLGLCSTKRKRACSAGWTMIATPPLCMATTDRSTVWQ